MCKMCGMPPATIIIIVQVNFKNKTKMRNKNAMQFQCTTYKDNDFGYNFFPYYRHNLF